jgi:murein DD-endopeptidase MepM/ murein hydrolase activator NlpD
MRTNTKYIKLLFSRKFIIIVTVGLFLAGLVTYLSLPQIPFTEFVDMSPKSVSIEVDYPYEIEPGTTLSSSLDALGVNPQTVHDIVKAAKPVANLARLRPGVRFQLQFADEDENVGPLRTLSGIKFRFSAVELLEIKKAENNWTAEKITEKVDTKIITFAGIVESSLWESAEKADMDPNLISELAEIFAWQVDFAREVRANDRWRLSVEKRTVKGEFLEWGSILAAEYENAGDLHTAALFRKDGRNLGYFTPDGSSLRRMFLKSPIKYGRISSRFSTKRFHPILKLNRPHLGVDYAAPKGTPIRSVGDGTISYTGWNGGGGNTIKIRHNSIYQTAYKHLSGFAKGIRQGARVEQGQVIGYVGNTGLSTGSHLHFEFYQSGRFLDPLSKKFPSADPVPNKLLAEFQTQAAGLMASLPAWGDVAEARSPASESKTPN